MDENVIVYQAIRRIMNPKLVNNDICIFDNIMRDMFPTVKECPVAHPELREHVKKTFEANNLQPTPYLVERVLELHDTAKVRHGLMVIG